MYYVMEQRILKYLIIFYLMIINIYDYYCIIKNNEKNKFHIFNI